MYESGVPRRRRRFGVIVAGLAAVSFVVPASGAGAAPAGARSAAPGVARAVPADPSEKELAKLEKESKTLAKQYRGQITSLDDARSAARKAGRKAASLNRQLRAAETKVRRLAVMSYTDSGGPMSTTFAGDSALPMMIGGDINQQMGEIAVLQHLARGNGQRVHDLSGLATKADTAKRTANGKIGDAKKLVDRLKKRRGKVQKLLAKYAPQSPTSRPDGAPQGKSPLVGDNVTPRMRNVRTIIDQRFGPFPTIGCFRAGDQDHGTGTACDFMESTGGQMPSAAAQAHGDKVAQYAISHASSLGVKYIIWKQRIYDIRAGGGWSPMEDRGSVTANHFDHVHVSVL